MSQGWFHTSDMCAVIPWDRPLRAVPTHLKQWCPFLPVGLTW